MSSLPIPSFPKPDIEYLYFLSPEFSLHLAYSLTSNLERATMSFSQFALLPPEIQIKIWAFHLPSPRIVDLFPVSERLQPSFEYDATTSPPFSSPSSSSVPVFPTANTAAAQQATKWTRTFIERIYTSPHKLQHLHICTEARKIALRRYVSVNADLELKGNMRFNYLIPQPDEEGGDEKTTYCLAASTIRAAF
jgi:hypothetical protein